MQPIYHDTPAGRIAIRNFCSPEEIQRCTFDPQFGTHAHYKSLYTKRASLEKSADQSDANVTMAVFEERQIVGFGVLAYPDPGDRWAQMEPPVLIEVKAVEVSRPWRTKGLARKILERLLAHPLIEEKIVYMVGYSWTWDLDGTKQTAQQYRAMLLRLFHQFGFKEYPTNEPNICLKPENLFMGRLGANVSESDIESFKWLRFGVYD